MNARKCALPNIHFTGPLFVSGWSGNEREAHLPVWDLKCFEVASCIMWFGFVMLQCTFVSFDGSNAYGK